MWQSDPFIAIAVLMAAALVGGLIAHRLRQPVILGYLIIGVVVGPHSLGLVSNLEIIEAAATIGVTLLMFTLGMEFSIFQLKEIGRIGIWGSIFQIVITVVLGMVAGLVVFHWTLIQAVIFGLVISLSSTAVCMKTLMDRGELSSIQGRIMIAILIMQDISVIFMTLALPLIPWRRLAPNSARRYCLIAGVSIFVLFSLSRAKLVPYILPAIPPLAVRHVVMKAQ